MKRALGDRSGSSSFPRWHVGIIVAHMRSPNRAASHKCRLRIETVLCVVALWYCGSSGRAFNRNANGLWMAPRCWLIGIKRCSLDMSLLNCRQSMAHNGTHCSVASGSHGRPQPNLHNLIVRSTFSLFVVVQRNRLEEIDLAEVTLAECSVKNVSNSFQVSKTHI